MDFHQKKKTFLPVITLNKKPSTKQVVPIIFFTGEKAFFAATNFEGWRVFSI